MKDIAQKMWTVRRALVNARYDKQCRQTDLSTREAELTLVAQGKNAEERKANLALLLRADTEYQDAVDAAAKNQHQLKSLEAEEAYLLDLRRAHEWHIRLQMASALSGKHIASEGSDPDAQDALDDAHIDQAFTSPSRPAGEWGSQGRLLRNIPTSYEVPDSFPAPPHRNAPVMITTDDEVPF